MALYRKTLIIPLQTGTGTQSVTGVNDVDTGTAFELVAGIVMGAAVLNTMSALWRLNTGFAAAGVGGCGAGGSETNDFGAKIVRSGDGTAELWAPSGGIFGGMWLVGTITNITAGAFDLTLTTNAYVGEYLAITALGGDIQATVAAVDSLVAFRSTTFPPDVLLFNHAGNDGFYSFGYAERENGTRGTAAILCGSQAANGRYQRSDKAYAYLASSTTLAHEHDITSWDATGFTLDSSTPGPTRFMALQGCRSIGFARTQPGVATDTFSTGILPKLVLVFTSGKTAGTTVAAEEAGWSMGMFDGSTVAGFWTSEDRTNNTNPLHGARYLSDADLLLYGTPPDGATSTLTTKAQVSWDSVTGEVSIDFSDSDGVSREYFALVLGEDLPPPPVPFTDGEPGELVTLELTDRDATVRPYAQVDLNDEPDYYGGYKGPFLLTIDPIGRGLSDYTGQMEHPTFGGTVADPDRSLRGLFDSATNRYLWGCPLIVRTVGDEDRRAELPMRHEIIGTVSDFSPSEDLRFKFVGSTWLKRKLSRKTEAPEYWVPVLTRADFPLLPDALLNKMAPLAYGKVSDAVDGITVDPDLYPRGTDDPGWLTLGYNHWAAAGPAAGDYCLYVTTITGGVESTVTPFMVGFHLDGSQQVYAYFATTATPDFYRVYFSDGRDTFHPFLAPNGGTFARYQDFTAAALAPPDPDPFGNPNPDGTRFVLIDSVGWGSDYQAIASTGGTTIRAARGAAPTLYVGDETYGGITRSAFLVARGAVKSIVSVHIGGVEHPTTGSATEIEVPFLDDYATTFGANYRDINGTRYTIVYATGHTAVRAISGEAPITVNFWGYETVGDTTGDLIVSPVRVRQHFERNFLCPDSPSDVALLWLTVAPDLPGAAGLPMQDDDSYDVADAALAARLTGGYECAGIIGNGGDVESALDVLAALHVNGDFDAGTNRLGQSMVSVEPFEAPADADTVPLTDVLHIIDRSFSAKTDQTKNFWNQIPFRHTRDYTGLTETGWFLRGLSIDAASVTNYQQERTATDLEFRFLRSNTVQGADTILDVVKRKRTRWRHPLRTVSLAVPYLASNGVELGSVLRLDHVEGIGAAGWVGHDVRVVRVETDLDAMVRRLECYDLQPVYDGLDDGVAPTQEDLGLRHDSSLLQLQGNVQDLQIDLSTVQAEILSLDARVTVLEDGILPVRTTDPASPTNDTAWIYRDGATPQGVELRLRIGGTTYYIPLGTI